MEGKVGRGQEKGEGKIGLPQTPWSLAPRCFGPGPWPPLPSLLSSSTSLPPPLSSLPLPSAPCSPSPPLPSRLLPSSSSSLHSPSPKGTPPPALSFPHHLLFPGLTCAGHDGSSSPAGAGLWHQRDAGVRGNYKQVGGGREKPGVADAGIYSPVALRLLVAERRGVGTLTTNKMAEEGRTPD